jgi:hypothetical protein
MVEGLSRCHLRRRFPLTRGNGRSQIDLSKKPPYDLRWKRFVIESGLAEPPMWYLGDAAAACG